jgi:N-acetylmuramoyl-L-alanine amidase
VLAAFGFSTLWNETSQKLIFKNKSGAGVLSPLSPYVIFDTQLVRLNSKPLFIDAKLFVPIEFVTLILPKISGKKSALKNDRPKLAPSPAGLPYQPLFLKRIVLDAGHGGHDPGAKSPGGMKEKDVVLAVAQRLAIKLQDEMGIEVVMTRNDDRFITLGNRARIANTSGAQIFVSIHANGAFNDEATGTETYFLSFEASDRKSAQIARAENASVQLELDNPFQGSAGDDLKAILWDLVQTETLKESEKLAIAVQSKLMQQMNMPSRGVKQAPFYVLMGSSIPAILVEIGFITTRHEANQLADPFVQTRIANALFMAILNYDTLRAIQSSQ